MSDLVFAKQAGAVLRKLINENYKNQQEFAWDYGLEIRSVNRYINKGINRVDIIESLADFFGISLWDYLDMTKEIEA